MLRGVLEAQAPPRQNASDTINTLSSRLASATLLEDRRSAILGLRSFAKEYPASVASGALKTLISTLATGVDDVDTAKVVLETLLLLFNPNDTSPEASDDIALWLADEFSQRQENITVLLELLNNSDFYSRLYSLQLLSAISSARLERTQECILSSPLGTSRLVAILDDPRDAVRSAALLLLNDVTLSSPELQKLVAFENAFDRIFNLMQAEGSLLHGGIIVQECLSLLANLLQRNAHNQSLFRETGFVSRLAQLLVDTLHEQQAENAVADDPSTDKNLWGFLALIRLFLVHGNLGTQANQLAFEKHSLLQQVLNLAFGFTTSVVIRAEAIFTCADIIRGNGKVQERFAHHQVYPLGALAPEKGAGRFSNGEHKVYIIDALLDLVLTNSTLSMFDVRLAASECIQAYFYNHKPIKMHFLNRAIEGHTSGDDETSNVLSILVGGPRNSQSSEPYRFWFAGVLLFHLVFDDPEAKKLVMKITDGDESQGEEVIPCIQAMTGNLIATLESGEDDRICVGYLILLCGLLFEDAEAVNDFLAEGAFVRAIVQNLQEADKSREIAQGLCALLLGLMYEFSTKDSPISRRDLHPLLASTLGREQYIQRLTRLREHPLVRNFEVLPQGLSSPTPPGSSLPPIYFDQVTVDFVRDNYSRMLRAIDRDPRIEVLARTQEGVDRDLVDSLRAQLRDKSDAVQKAASDLSDRERRLNQEQSDHRKSQETFKAELARIKNINAALQQGHEADTERADAEHRLVVSRLREDQQRTAQDLTGQLEQAQREAQLAAQASTENHRLSLAALNRQIEQLTATTRTASETITLLRQNAAESAATLAQQVSQTTDLHTTKDVLEENISQHITNVRRLETLLRESDSKLAASATAVREAQTRAEAKEEARLAAQTELDDLLIVLGDLEEKRVRDKKRLKEAGLETSDAEDDDDDDNDDDNDDDHDDDDDTANAEAADEKDAA